MRLETRSRIFGFILLLPALLVVSSLIVYPLIQTGIFSFQSYSLIKPGEQGKFVGLRNFYKIIHDRDFKIALENTIIYVFGVTIISFLIAMAIALLLNQNLMGAQFFKPLFLVPWAIPMVAISMVWLWVFNPEYGIVNFILKDLNLISNFKRWVTDPSLAMFTVMLAGIWSRIPFLWIMLLAGLQNIPQTLYEAAEVDGANLWQRFIYITIPGLRNVIVVVTLVTIIWNFQMFTIIWIMTKGGPIKATTTFSILLYKLAFHEYDFALASALGIIWLFGLMFFSIVFTRIFQSKV